MTRALWALALLPALASPAAALTVPDMLGRAVELAAPPARIVSLVPSVTETLFALGAEDRLVGVTDFCDYPPAARRKPSVGGMVNPNLEVIVSLRPDLVVATTEGNREETFAQRERLPLELHLHGGGHRGQLAHFREHPVQPDIVGNGHLQHSQIVVLAQPCLQLLEAANLTTHTRRQ